ncbi:hypothetical protein Cadr_000031399, partial [Camelus dromedarius]
TELGFGQECVLGLSLRAASEHHGLRKCLFLPLKAFGMLGRKGPSAHTRASLGDAGMWEHDGPGKGERMWAGRQVCIRP